MNGNFIKEYFKAVVVAVFSAATISACEKSPAAKDSGYEKEDVESYDSEIRLTGSNIVKVNAAESEFTVTFEVSGANSDGTVTAVPGNDWLSIVADKSGGSPADILKSGAGGDSADGTSEDDGSAEGEDTHATRSLKFKAAENGSAGSRTGSVTFKLDGAKDIKCTVIQAANPDYVVNRQMTFTLDVTDIAEASVRFTVAPSMSDSYYLYAFVTKESYDSYGGNFVEMTVKEIQEYAAEYEEKYETPFVLKNRLYKGYVSTTASGLNPDTDYYLVAFDITLGYGYSGNVTKFPFKTHSVPPSSDAFTITYNETTGVVMFTPAESATGFFSFGVAPLTVWEAAKAPSALVSEYITNTSSLPVYNTSDGARGLPISKYSDITDDTDYVAFAFSYNQSTGKASDISWIQFHFKK